MPRCACLVLSLILAVPRSAAAQDGERYLVLAATRTGTMQEEINAAAARGYRVVAASRTEGAEVVVALERTAASYRYRLLATTRTGTLQTELTQGAEAGFRVVPRAVTTKRPASSGVARALGNNNPGEGEVLILMERGPETVPGLRPERRRRSSTRARSHA